MLRAASRAPEIDTIDNHGQRFRLSEQSKRLCTVLFFFPRAFTPGCSRETGAFFGRRDAITQDHDEVLTFVKELGRVNQVRAEA